VATAVSSRSTWRRVCTHPCIAQECTDGSCKLAAGERYATAVINSGGLQHAHHEPTWQRLGVCRAVCADAVLEVVVRRAPAHALIVEAAALAGDTDAGGGKDGALLALAHALIVEGAVLAGDAVALRVRACSPSPRGKDSVSGDRSQQPQHMACVCVHTLASLRNAQTTAASWQQVSAMRLLSSTLVACSMLIMSLPGRDWVFAGQSVQTPRFR